MLLSYDMLSVAVKQREVHSEGDDKLIQLPSLLEVRFPHENTVCNFHRFEVSMTAYLGDGRPTVAIILDDVQSVKDCPFRRETGLPRTVQADCRELAVSFNCRVAFGGWCMHLLRDVLRTLNDQRYKDYTTGPSMLTTDPTSDRYTKNSALSQRVYPI